MMKSVRKSKMADVDKAKSKQAALRSMSFDFWPSLDENYVNMSTEEADNAINEAMEQYDQWQTQNRFYEVEPIYVNLCPSWAFRPIKEDECSLDNISNDNVYNLNIQ